ncbi:MAG TPA: glycosyltransferase [Rhizomicrobium sp.]|nr:glycosyltransferase [Rhizomicrobium sp.]
MIVSVIAAGTRGDAQPPAMLCRELARYGHEVRFIAQREFADMIEGSDVLLRPLPGDLHTELNSADAQKFFAGGGNPLTFLRWFYDVGRKFAAQLTPALAEFTAGSHMIVGTGLADYASNIMARVHKTKAAHAYMQPAIPTREFPCALFSVPPFDLPGWANKLEARIYFETAWLGARPIANVAHKMLGLPPPPWRVPVLEELNRGQPFLMAYSEAFLPKPKDWPDHVEVTGFWFRDTPASWQPPADLVRFIESGPPPIYAGFGSMVMKDPEATVNAVLEAVAKNNARAVIASGWSGYRPEKLPDNVFAVDSIPHDWLLPKMAAGIHHGGAGTTGACLRAGIPQVVVPFVGDQFFWGLQVEKRGVAPKRIPHSTLTAQALGDAIGKVLSDPAMRKRAAEMGERVRAENGLARAAAVIEQVVRA